MSSENSFISKALKNLSLSYRGYTGPYPAPEKWVFLIGCYNSGTTLLHQILASHSSIGSLPVEGQICTNQFVTPQELNIPRLWAIKKERFHLLTNDTPASVATRVKRQWGYYFNDIHRPVLLEKSITNAARVQWLNQHFENAHFISIIRNGYAVAEGIHRKTGHSLSLAARQWSLSNEIMFSDLETVPKKLLLSYEDFTDNPQKILQTIADFIGIENTFIKGDINSKDWLIHGISSHIKNMNPVSISRLSADDVDVINKEALSPLKHFGYYQENTHAR